MNSPLLKVRAEAFSQDGKMLTEFDDKTLHLWDVENGKPLAVLKGLEGPVDSASFSPDGQRPRHRVI